MSHLHESDRVKQALGDLMLLNINMINYGIVWLCVDIVEITIFMTFRSPEHQLSCPLDDLVKRVDTPNN